MVEIINDVKHVKARKAHVCNWCGFTINVGEVYQSSVLKYDGIYAWKNHLKCAQLVDKLDMEGDDGVTGEDFYEYIRNEFMEIWRELDNEHYESKDFKIPSFKDQLEFVYEHRVNKN